jgi:hypothetical protein
MDVQPICQGKRLRYWNSAKKNRVQAYRCKNSQKWRKKLRAGEFAEFLWITLGKPIAAET